MPRSLDDYIDIVGPAAIYSIFSKARKLYGKQICHINATFLGGGVAEILGRLVPLLNEAGLSAEWRTISGSPAFFDVTKRFHNALQGSRLRLSRNKKDLYLDVNQEFLTFTRLDHDCIVVHDPQPLPLIKFHKKSQPWIWRCHIDISNPPRELWSFLEKFMIRYDMIIVSSEQYRRKDLPIEQRVIHPAIDPLSLKNRDLPDKDLRRYAERAHIPTDKPLLTQVSRMDPWKDPEGVLEVYKRVREKVDCRLLYCYNLATDDPQGMEIYTRIRQMADKLVRKGDVLFVVGNNDVLVNAVQQLSTVIIQKSIKEGFGLTVTEALWKRKPVVASNVGGIPLQIKDGETGYLLEPNDYDGFAERIVHILKDPSGAKSLGEKARRHVRDNFLITRLVSDYLDLIGELHA
ncbi:MAG: glycosyltransferase [Sedimentisphaerales bacterium]|nr:glycosyltransferase [Sedimentisphaerales bacterium]